MQVAHKQVPSTGRAEALRLALVVQLHAERIGRRIQQRRLELKAESPEWTQPHVAEKVNELTGGKATGAEVSRWETGRHRPGDETLDALATVLGVDVAYFHAAEPRERGSTPDVVGALNGERGPYAEQLDRIEELLEEVLRRLPPAETEERDDQPSVPDRLPDVPDEGESETRQAG